MTWSHENGTIWTGYPRKYRINLVWGSARGYQLGGTEVISASDWDMAYIMGGLNDWGNPEVYYPTTNYNVLLNIWQPQA
jgi:hypothetical protein